MIAMAVSALSQEQSWSTAGWHRDMAKAGNCARAVLAPGGFQSAASNREWEQTSLHTCSLRAESLYLTALWEAPLVFKPTKGAHLPGTGPQDWGACYNS